MAGYVIAPGDTLSQIARREGTSVRALMQANPQISNPNMIRAGGELALPGAPPSPAPTQVQHALKQGQEADAQASRTQAADQTGVAPCTECEKHENPAQTPAQEPTDAELLGDIPTNPMDETEFGKSFEAKTGAKLSDTIAQYTADTGNDLTPDTVETLFKDPAKAKAILMEDKSLHQNYRDILNQNIPATAQEAKAAGYTEMSYIKSWYHDPWNNSKWVSPDGHREAVYNKTTGALDASDAYKGTFNFFGPDNFSGHKAADVDPYRKWGN